MLLQPVAKTFGQTSPNSILEDFVPFFFFLFYANFTSPNQFLLDRGIGLVVFGADCYIYFISCTQMYYNIPSMGFLISNEL